MTATGPPDVLRIEEVERPAPKDDELLVAVRATTVNRFDCHTREMMEAGCYRPVIDRDAAEDRQRRPNRQRQLMPSLTRSAAGL